MRVSVWYNVNATKKARNAKMSEIIVATNVSIESNPRILDGKPEMSNSSRDLYCRTQMAM